MQSESPLSYCDKKYTRTIAHSHTHSYTRTLVHSCPRTLVPSYTRTLVHSYTRTLAHSYTRTLVHSYTRTLAHSHTHTRTYERTDDRTNERTGAHGGSQARETEPLEANREKLVELEVAMLEAAQALDEGRFRMQGLQPLRRTLQRPNGRRRSMFARVAFMAGAVRRTRTKLLPVLRERGRNIAEEQLR